MLGLPFDIGTSYRPGARFGPLGIRNGSRLLRPYHVPLKNAPFHDQQVVDAGDLALSTYIIDDAIAQATDGARELTSTGAKVVALGGDHTMALPMLRAAVAQHGPVA